MIYFIKSVYNLIMKQKFLLFSFFIKKKVTYTLSIPRCLEKKSLITFVSHLEMYTHRFYLKYFIKISQTDKKRYKT